MQGCALEKAPNYDFHDPPTVQYWSTSEFVSSPRHHGDPEHSTALLQIVNYYLLCFVKI